MSTQGYEGPASTKPPADNQIPFVAPRRRRAASDNNQQVLDYVRDRLGEKTSTGQCVLHIGPGGVIRRVEWHSGEDVDDIISQVNGADV